MNDEPKSAAELKEIRLNRKRTQEVEGIKAMAEIAACRCRDPKADREIARDCVWRRKRPTVKTPRNRRSKARPRPRPRKEADLK
jgi:hypothetical protein